jgi:hypothetical protein
MSLKLVTILAYTIALPAGVGLYFYRSLTSPLRTLVILFVFGTFTELLATLFREYFSNNVVVYNTYMIVESFFFLLFISESSIRYRNIYRAAQLIVILVGLFETSLNPKAYNTLSAAMESVMVILGILFIFYRVAFGTDIDRNVFLISGVILFYFLSNSIYFSLRAHLEMDSLIFVSWVHIWINAICNVTYALILWKASRSKLLLLA